MIKAWSFSKLMDFEQCKRMAHIKHVLKIPEPERPLPPGKTEHANDRGTRVHQAAEDFVRGVIPALIPELGKFQPELLHLRNLFLDGKVSMEGEWGMDRDWGIVNWNGEWREADQYEGDPKPKKVKVLPEHARADEWVQIGKVKYVWVPVWQRGKVDVIVHVSPTEAVIIDYKTGRKYGNELKHGQQLNLYTLIACLRFPHLEKVTTELWYTDQDEITSMSFTRAQGLRFLDNYERRGEAITTCQVWPPSPSIHSCKWCPYGETGHCDVSAKNAFPSKKPFIQIKEIS